MEFISDVSYELYYVVDIDLDHIPTEPEQFFQWQCDYVFWVFHNTVSCHQYWNTYIIFFYVGWIRVSFEWDHLLYVLHHYLDWNMSLQLFILNFIHQCFVVLIITIRIGWSCVKNPIVDSRSLYIYFARFVWYLNYVDHGWWVIIFCLKFRNNDVYKHMFHIFW